MTKEELRELRKDAHLSQARLAELCGIAQQQVAAYESGTRSFPLRAQLLMLHGLAKAGSRESDNNKMLLTPAASPA